MSIFEGIHPSEEMLKAVKATAKKQAEIQGLVKRLEKQRQVVADLSETIEDMVTKQPWKKCLKPEAALASKGKLMETKDKFVEEQEMLEAVELALANTRRDAQHVLSQTERAIKGAFSAVAVKSEEQMLANLDKAMEEFMMSRLANGPGFQGATFELEMKAKDTQKHMEVSKKFGELYKDLRERVSKAAQVTK